MKKYLINIVIKSDTSIKIDLSKLKSKIIDYISMESNDYHVHDVAINKLTESDYSLRNSEYQLIISALKLTNGNRTSASVLLGISERTLYRKIKDYKIDIPGIHPGPTKNK